MYQPSGDINEKEICIVILCEIDVDFGGVKSSTSIFGIDTNCHIIHPPKI
jgi:hypothetical protein